MIWPGGHDRIYSIAWRTWHGMAWRGMGWYMVWHNGMTCIMYGLIYGLAGMAWHIVRSGGHGLVYGMAWRASHGICGEMWHSIGNGLVGYGMVYGMACQA